MQLLGIAIVLGTVFGGFLLMGGKLSVIWEPVEILIDRGNGARPMANGGQ